MDFTLESALLFLSQNNPKSEEDYKNREAAQRVIKDSGLDSKELDKIRRRVLAEDKADKKIIKYQQMPSKQKDMVDNMGKMGIGMKGNKGGLTKPKMMSGGMAYGKKHMYVAGGSVRSGKRGK